MKAEPNRLISRKLTENLEHLIVAFRHWLWQCIQKKDCITASCFK